MDMDIDRDFPMEINHPASLGITHDYGTPHSVMKFPPSQPELFGFSRLRETAEILIPFITI
jgi:hypothetical protein